MDCVAEPLLTFLLGGQMQMSAMHFVQIAVDVLTFASCRYWRTAAKHQTLIARHEVAYLHGAQDFASSIAGVSVVSSVVQHFTTSRSIENHEPLAHSQTLRACALWQCRAVRAIRARNAVPHDRVEARCTSGALLNTGAVVIRS